MPGRRGKVSRRDSIFVLSALVGAVALARSVNDEQLSFDILRSTAEALKSNSNRTSVTEQG